MGLLSISGVVGAVASFFADGRLIDLIATRMAARRGEHPEPEFRLPAMIVPAVIGPVEILTYGLVIAGSDNWRGAAVGYSMEGFGAIAAANIVITYAVDAYRPVSLSCLHVSWSSRMLMAICRLSGRRLSLSSSSSKTRSPV